MVLNMIKHYELMCHGAVEKYVNVLCNSKKWWDYSNNIITTIIKHQDTNSNT